MEREDEQRGGTESFVTLAVLSKCSEAQQVASYSSVAGMDSDLFVMNKISEGGVHWVG